MKSPQEQLRMANQMLVMAGWINLIMAAVLIAAAFAFGPRGPATLLHIFWMTP